LLLAERPSAERGKGECGAQNDQAMPQRELD